MSDQRNLYRIAHCPSRYNLSKDMNSSLGNPDNVILLTIDCLRWDHLSYSGYRRNTTPNLDDYIESNIWFENAFSASSHTPEAVPAMLSGRYPDVFSDNEYQRVVPTIADLLTESSVQTGAFHSNVHVSRVNGFQSGFDEFFDDLYFGRNRLFALGQKVINRFFKSRQSYYARADEINRRSLSWLDSLPDNQPFFLWNHYLDVHGPYEPFPEYQKYFRNEIVEREEARELFHRAIDEPDAISSAEHQILIDLYDAEIRYVDEQISDFLETIAEKEMLKNTLIILTADHGDGFAEHGYYNHPRQLHDVLVHVPFITLTPSTNNRHVETVTSTLDIVPTALRTFGEPIPEELPGIPLDDLLSSPKRYENRTVFLQTRGENEESNIRRFGARTIHSKAFVERDINTNSVLSKRCSENGRELLDELLDHSMERSLEENKIMTSEIDNNDGYLADDVEARLESLGYK